jgi:hypothetical protein
MHRRPFMRRAIQARKKFIISVFTHGSRSVASSPVVRCGSRTPDAEAGLVEEEEISAGVGPRYLRRFF